MTVPKMAIPKEIIAVRLTLFTECLAALTLNILGGQPASH